MKCSMMLYYHMGLHCLQKYSFSGFLNTNGYISMKIQSRYLNKRKEKVGSQLVLLKKLY